MDFTLVTDEYGQCNTDTIFNEKMRIDTLAIFSLLILFFSTPSFAENLDSVIQSQMQNDNLAKTSQVKVDQLASRTQALISKYKQTLKEIQSTRIYNQQMRASIKAQEDEKKSIRQQIREVKYTDKKIIPLMVEMIDALEQFIEIDLPFLLQERRTRVQKLKTTMKRPDISTSEKYRSLLEAYQIENEYGRTVDTYHGIQKIKNKEFTVNYLRVGRVSYIYQTLDAKTQAYWSKEAKKWIDIPSRYEKEVSQGFKVAGKHLAPNLVLTFLKGVR